jgi:hypothetical protein
MASSCSVGLQLRNMRGWSGHFSPIASRDSAGCRPLGRDPRLSCASRSCRCSPLSSNRPYPSTTVVDFSVVGMISSHALEELTKKQPRDVYQATVKTAQQWARGLEAAATRIGARFRRIGLRQRATASRRRLISLIARKNGWPLAEAAGAQTPYGGQHVLRRAEWSDFFGVAIPGVRAGGTLWPYSRARPLSWLRRHRVLSRWHRDCHGELRVPPSGL